MDMASAAKKRKASVGGAETHFTEHFTDPEVDNLRIASVKAVAYPQLLMEEFPMTQKAKETVVSARQAIANVLHGRDDRLVVIVGPCSIHDPSAAREYAGRLKAELGRFEQDLVVLMRVYFEKPRTTIGWKGLINDPHLDDSFDINNGLKVARRLLAELSDQGVPCATEFLDTMTPQYIADLIAWAAIGARTTESQLHRQLASGLSMPVGFKNGTGGDCQIAIDAIRSSEHRHSFLSITKQGLPAIVLSMGNRDTHMILRGGATGTNYDAESIKKVVAQLEKNKVNARVMVDCSHGNSSKDYKRQPIVAADVCEQLKAGSDSVMGVMVESNLLEGKQDIPAFEESPKESPKEASGLPTAMPVQAYDFDSKTNSWAVGVRQEVLKKLRYGVSITDGCIGWMETVKVLEQLAAATRARRELRAKAQ